MCTAPGIAPQESSPEDALIKVSETIAATTAGGILPTTTSGQEAINSEEDTGEASWGLDTLVIVGKHWIPKLLQVRGRCYLFLDFNP